MSDANPTTGAEVARDAAPVAKLALRDGALFLGGLSLWAAADAWFAVTGLRLAAALSVANGLLAGFALTRLAHEWGHFAGARWAGGIAPTTSITTFSPLFSFDMQRSAPAAFRAMSLGGNLGHWALVLMLALALPLDTAGRAALVCASFGYAVFASATEWPVIRKAYAGASAIESFAGFSGEKLRRNRWVGAAAALGLFLAL